MRHTITILVSLALLTYITTSFSACDHKPSISESSVQVWDSLQVTASAYNSVRSQTGIGDPTRTAWGDTLVPGLKAIAVSRDLIRKGLSHNTPVIIEGFEGIYLVKDKMHYRWKNKIDIYMGEDINEALKFGRKKLKIYFLTPKDSLVTPGV